MFDGTGLPARNWMGSGANELLDDDWVFSDGALWGQQQQQHHQDRQQQPQRQQKQQPPPELELEQQSGLVGLGLAPPLREPARPTTPTAPLAATWDSLPAAVELPDVQRQDLPEIVVTGPAACPCPATPCQAGVALGTAGLPQRRPSTPSVSMRTSGVGQPHVQTAVPDSSAQAEEAERNELLSDEVVHRLESRLQDMCHRLWDKVVFVSDQMTALQTQVAQLSSQVALDEAQAKDTADLLKQHSDDQAQQNKAHTERQKLLEERVTQGLKSARAEVAEVVRSELASMELHRSQDLCDALEERLRQEIGSRMWSVDAAVETKLAALASKIDAVVGRLNEDVDRKLSMATGDWKAEAGQLTKDSAGQRDAVQDLSKEVAQLRLSVENGAGLVASLESRLKSTCERYDSSLHQADLRVNQLGKHVMDESAWVRSEVVANMDKQLAVLVSDISKLRADVDSGEDRANDWRLRLAHEISERLDQETSERRSATSVAEQRFEEGLKSLRSACERQTEAKLEECRALFEQRLAASLETSQGVKQDCNKLAELLEVRLDEFRAAVKEDLSSMAAFHGDAKLWAKLAQLSGFGGLSSPPPPGPPPVAQAAPPEVAPWYQACGPSQPQPAWPRQAPARGYGRWQSRLSPSGDM